MIRKGVLLLTMLVALLAVTMVLGWGNVAAGAIELSGGETAVSPVGASAPTHSCFPTGNLLINPGFEMTYTQYIYPEPGHPDCQDFDNNGTTETCERALMPPGWHPRWRMEPRPETWINVMPHYIDSTPDQVNPDRVRNGGRSLHYWSFYSTHESAVHQQVTATIGANYCFSAYGHAWSDAKDDDFYSAKEDEFWDDGQLYQRVGIDPTGGTDYLAETVVWSDERKQYDVFDEFLAQAPAVSNTITVFIYSRSDHPVKHNDVYWDDAFLSVQQSLTVAPASLGFMTTVTDPVTMTVPLQLDLTSHLSWTAELTPTGMLTPQLSAGSGAAGQHLTVTMSSGGLMTGTYTTTLVIAAGLENVAGSPFHVPITVHVVDKIDKTFVPLVGKQ